MVTIRFPDDAAKRRALGFLAGRFSFKSWATGAMAIPEEPPRALSREGIPYHVEDVPPAEPTRAEVIAAHERGETLDVVDAFAKLAGVSRDEWLRRVAERQATRGGGRGVSLPFRTQVSPAAMAHIQSWGLSDPLLVDVFLWLYGRLPERPSQWLDPAPEPDGGMLLRFSVVDPENRFCEHTFQFRIYYHADEVTLFVASGTHRRQVGF